MLPLGLSLNAANGTISGTPSASAISPIIIVVMAANAIGSESFRIAVRVLTKPVVFHYPDAIMVYTVNDRVSIIPTAEGDLIEYSLQGDLPEGLQLDRQTGGITGTATKATKRVFITVVASNEVGSISCSIIIRILTPITSVVYPMTKVSLVKGRHSSLLPSCDGDEPSFSVSNGALPDGLTLNNATGVIEGVPTTSRGKSPVTIQVSNDVSAIETTLYVKVLPLPVALLVIIPIIVIIIVDALVIVLLFSKRKRLPVRTLKAAKRGISSNINVRVLSITTVHS